MRRRKGQKIFGVKNIFYWRRRKPEGGKGKNIQRKILCWPRKEDVKKEKCHYGCDNDLLISKLRKTLQNQQKLPFANKLKLTETSLTTFELEIVTSVKFLKHKLLIHLVSKRPGNDWIHPFKNVFQSFDFDITLFHTLYLSFFLHGQNFWKIKFTPKFTQQIADLHSKLPIYTVSCQFFALNL